MGTWVLAASSCLLAYRAGKQGPRGRETKARRSNGAPIMILRIKNQFEGDQCRNESGSGNSSALLIRISQYACHSPPVATMAGDPHSRGRSSFAQAVWAV